MATSRAMSRGHGRQLWMILTVILGSSSLSSAQVLPNLPNLPPLPPLPLLSDVIRWDPIREVWVDMKTKGVVNVVSNSVTNPIPGSVVAAAPAFTQQGETRPQRPSDKSFFPLVLPDKEWFKDCGRNLSDVLTMKTTGCDVFKDVINCQQLAAMGYLPPGVQSYSPGGNLNGGFSLPNGCSSGNLGVEYNGLRMVFNSPQVPILAVIAKELPFSRVYYFGSGVTQGRLLNIIMHKAEFCYAPPSVSPLYVSKTAQYSTGMQPGTAAWNFFKTVSLAPPFSNNVAAMFRGDTADATWVLSVSKTGTDTSYQGSVSGQITITNPQAEAVTVYNINDYIQGGPQATVTCGTPVPFTIQPCSSTVCNYITYWPAAPPAGTYTTLADVQYSVGTSGIVGNQVGTAMFPVASIQEAVGVLNTAAGAIPAGQAIVQDGMAPQQYFFSGTTQQSYTTSLSCPDTAIITNEAMLTASTGQQVKQAATVQKLCFELQVRVAQTSAPFIGRWSWSVDKQASRGSLTLRPSETSWDRYVRQQVDLAVASGQDPSVAMRMITGGQNATAVASASAPATTNEEVTYTVTFTRTPPSTVASGTPAFQTTGNVFITNSSPLNAALREVQVTISNPFGGLPYTTTASCDLLTVPAGQTLQCRYIATPSFNPVGAQVTAAAVYLNTRNGVPSGGTTSFVSAPVIVGSGETDSSSKSGRKLHAATSGPEGVMDNIAKSLSNLMDRANSQPREEITITAPEIIKPEDIESINITLPEPPSNPLASLANLTKQLPNVTIPVPDRNPFVQLGKVLSSLTQNPQSTAQTAGTPPTVAAAAAAAAPATAAASPPPPPAAASPPPPMPIQPVVAAAPAPTTFDLEGLQDECVEVKDLFARGSNYVTGVITSGEIPTGRICRTTSFTYTVRYGPFSDCFEKQAANQASFTTADTKTTGNATRNVDIRVEGCGAAIAAKARTYAVWAKKSYSWSVQKSSAPSSLTLAPGKTGKVTYTVDYTRKEILVNPKLSTTLQFDNLAATSAAPISNFSYSIQSQCSDGPKSKTGTFKCAAEAIPAGGAPLSCQIQVDLPCVGPGTLVARALSKGKAVATAPFNFPAPKSIDTLAESECADVMDRFAAGSGLVSGNVTAGVRPGGKLCGSKQFQYTVTFGPFATCGKRRATNTASLTTGSPTRSASAPTTLDINVAGCEVYTPSAEAYANPSQQPNPSKPPNPSAPPAEAEPPQVVVAEVPAGLTDANMRKAAPGAYAAPKGISSTKCVSSVAFWKGCMNSNKLTGRCAVIMKLPIGPHTAFFPVPNNKVLRTYKGILTRSTNTGLKKTDMWFKAAQAVAATQLNELAGIQLPTAVRDALSLVGAAIASTTSAPPVLSNQLQGVPHAVAVLQKFISGQAGVPTC